MRCLRLVRHAERTASAAQAKSDERSTNNLV
jgi:hypothetical protein